MEDFICVLLTSRNCGHCNHFRGNGLIENGKQLMKYSYIKSITKHCTFLNVHYNDMSGKNNTIESISKFTTAGNNIVQEIYGFFKENSIVSVIVHDGNKIKKINAEEIKLNNENVTWKKFIEKKIPLKLSNYTYFYPCFLFISKRSWKQGLKGKEFYALTNAGITKKFPNGTIGLDKTSQSINSRNVQPEILLKDLVNKKTDLDLYLSDNKNPEKSNQEFDRPESPDNSEENFFVLKSFEEE